MNLQVTAFQYFCPTSFCRVFFNSRDERCGSLLISLLPSSYQRQHCDKEIAVAAMVTLVPCLNGDHANAAVTLALQADAKTIVLAWCRCYRDRSASERRKFLECHAAEEKKRQKHAGQKDKTLAAYFSDVFAPHLFAGSFSIRKINDTARFLFSYFPLPTSVRIVTKRLLLPLW